LGKSNTLASISSISISKKRFAIPALVVTFQKSYPATVQLESRYNDTEPEFSYTIFHCHRISIAAIRGEKFSERRTHTSDLA